MSVIQISLCFNLPWRSNIVLQKVMSHRTVTFDVIDVTPPSIVLRCVNVVTIRKKIESIGFDTTAATKVWIRNGTD